MYTLLDVLFYELKVVIGLFGGGEEGEEERKRVAMVAGDYEYLVKMKEMDEEIREERLVFLLYFLFFIL